MGTWRGRGVALAVAVGLLIGCDTTRPSVDAALDLPAPVEVTEPDPPAEIPTRWSPGTYLFAHASPFVTDPAEETGLLGQLVGLVPITIVGESEGVVRVRWDVEGHPREGWLRDGDAHPMLCVRRPIERTDGPMPFKVGAGAPVHVRSSTEDEARVALQAHGGPVITVPRDALGVEGCSREGPAPLDDDEERRWPFPPAEACLFGDPTTPDPRDAVVLRRTELEALEVGSVEGAWRRATLARGPIRAHGWIPDGMLRAPRGLRVTGGLSTGLTRADVQLGRPGPAITLPRGTPVRYSPSRLEPQHVEASLPVEGGRLVVTGALPSDAVRRTRAARDPALWAPSWGSLGMRYDGCWLPEQRMPSHPYTDLTAPWSSDGEPFGTRSRMEALSRLDLASIRSRAAHGAVLRWLARGVIRECYERALVGVPTFEGRAVADVIVQPGGTVAGLRVEWTRGGDDGLERCVEQTIRGARFPVTIHGTTLLRYPLVFAPGSVR